MHTFFNILSYTFLSIIGVILIILKLLGLANCSWFHISTYFIADILYFAIEKLVHIFMRRKK